MTAQVTTSEATFAPHMDAQPMVSPRSSSERLAGDRFYGHRMISEVIERYLMATFECSADSMAATQDARSVSSPEAPRLAHFVAYALYRTRLPMLITYYGLFLLKRLKIRYPVARGSSGHRLFFSAFMIASKMVCDDSYNNKSWVIVGQHLFSLREVNQMERELLTYLDMHINASTDELSEMVTELEQYGAPSVRLEDLQHTRMPTTNNPTWSNSAAHAPNAQRSTAKMTSPSQTRRKSHRRCLSLRPDYWTQASYAQPASATAMHMRSSSSDWNAIARQNRSALRSSMPAQRTQAPSTAPYAYVPSVPRMPSAELSPWTPLYSTNSASSMSIMTPASMTDSLRPTPSTSMSELSLGSPWNMPTLPHGLPHAAAPTLAIDKMTMMRHPYANEVNDSNTASLVSHPLYTMYSTT